MPQVTREPATNFIMDVAEIHQPQGLSPEVQADGHVMVAIVSYKNPRCPSVITSPKPKPGSFGWRMVQLFRSNQALDAIVDSIAPTKTPFSMDEAPPCGGRSASANYRATQMGSGG
jgi:hypothetical protein